MGREMEKKTKNQAKPNKCWVCDREGGEIERGHLIDRVAGGSDNLNNIRPMCSECNMIKPVHETLFEVAEWKVRRHHEVLFGQSKPLSMAELISKITKVLTNDLGYPSFVSAWREFEENRKLKEEEGIIRKQKSLGREKRLEKAKTEPLRLWREWYEFNYPPHISKCGDFVIETSIIPTPKELLPFQQVAAFRQLFQKLFEEIND